jgi:hypothetical protein
MIFFYIFLFSFLNDWKFETDVVSGLVEWTTDLDFVCFIKVSTNYLWKRKKIPKVSSFALYIDRNMRMQKKLKFYLTYEQNQHDFPTIIWFNYIYNDHYQEKNKVYVLALLALSFLHFHEVSIWATDAHTAHTPNSMSVLMSNNT